MIKILLVDDRDSELSLLQLFFSSISHVSLIGLASNGQEAIAMVGKHHPDIVLMDIIMPIMDGIEATKIIHQQFRHTKVILYTSYDDRQVRNLAIKAGANAFVTKTHDFEHLARVISLVARGYEYFQFDLVPEKPNGLVTQLGVE